jgi:rubrerythrin
LNIFDFALQMEQDGENYYRELADQSKIEGLQKIFTMLADEEVKHAKVIKGMRENIRETQFEDSPLLDNVSNVFQTMRDKKQPLHINATIETGKYRKARDIEEVSHNFYRQKADESDSPHRRELFLRLAAEEAKHLRIMENIVEFVSRPEPGNWLENAEWTHLEPY